MRICSTNHSWIALQAIAVKFNRFSISFEIKLIKFTLKLAKFALVNRSWQNLFIVLNEIPAFNCFHFGEFVYFNVHHNSKVSPLCIAAASLVIAELKVGHSVQSQVSYTFRGSYSLIGAARSRRLRFSWHWICFFLFSSFSRFFRFYFLLLFFDFFFFFWFAINQCKQFLVGFPFFGSSAFNLQIYAN